MERTRTLDTLSNAVDNAFATVILSPDTFPFRHLEPYKQKIDAVIEKVISKHKIPAWHNLPITQFGMSETVFKLYKIASYLHEKFQHNHYDYTGGSVYITWKDEKVDLIYEHYQSWVSEHRKDFKIFQWFSLQDRIKPGDIKHNTRSSVFPVDFKFRVNPEINKEHPLAIMMLYDHSYIEVGDVHSNERGPIEITEIRPLRSKEAMNMIMNYRKMETMGLRIQPDPDAFSNVIYFQELPVFKVIWRPWTKKATISINGTKYEHPVHPDLVFAYGNDSVSVFILKKGMLYQVPYMNTSSGGSVCMGMNTTIKSGLLSKSLKRLEELFFYTKFTHINNTKYSNAIHLAFAKGEYKDIEFLKYKTLNEVLELSEIGNVITDNDDDYFEEFEM